MENLADRVFIQYSKFNITKDEMRDNLNERFLIGIYKDGMQKEFSISFYFMHNENTVRVEAESQAWELLFDSSDVLQELSKLSGGRTNPQDIHDMLIRLGIRDVTDELNNPKV